MIVTIDEAKLHLRIMGEDEDDVIQIYMAAAEEYIANYIDGDIPGSTDSPPDIPYSIKAAALLLIAGMYENRQSEGTEQIYRNEAVDNLLFPYRDNIGL